MTDNETDRIDELEDEIEFVDQKHQQRTEQVTKPRLAELEQHSDDARQERAELFALVEDLQERVAELDQRLTDMAGLAEDQQSNPDKRVSDLRQSMIRRAKARSDTDGFEKVALYYQEVQDIFAELGHGEISRPDCYKAMDDLAESDGFEIGKKSSADGNRVKAIRLDLAELRASAACRNPTTQQSPTRDGIEQERASSD